jgi:hypothetical protein
MWLFKTGVEGSNFGRGVAAIMAMVWQMVWSLPDHGTNLYQVLVTSVLRHSDFNRNGACIASCESSEDMTNLNS